MLVNTFLFHHSLRTLLNGGPNGRTGRCDCVSIIVVSLMNQNCYDNNINDYSQNNAVFSCFLILNTNISSKIFFNTNFGSLEF
jgi:hypothetical protein